jgi:DNA-binding LacI/PurR family transcriptional regulator
MVEFIQALVGATGARSHQLLLTRDGDDHESLHDLVRTSSVDGVILADVAPTDERVRMLARARVPFACFGRTEPELPQAWTDIDNASAARAVTELVLARGHRRVAFLGFGNDAYWDRERESGYRAAMAGAGLDARSVLSSTDSATAAAAVESMLDGPRPPSAFVSGSDSLAALVYSVAALRGLRVGEDLAVTGFDGGVMSRLLTPTLTTVVIPVDVIAERLLDRLLRELDGPTGDPGEVVQASVREGGSA